MRTIVCQKETVGAAVRYATLALVLVPLAAGQSANWRHIGSPAVELMLASPATGPVDSVWFGSDGRLFARTHSGRTFETSDFEIWTPSATVTQPLAMHPQVSRIPETNAQVVAAGMGSMFALGKNLYRSDDSGQTWNNLTGYKTESVIGTGQRSVDVGPKGEIVVANDFGVWRSMDNGLSWIGLNQGLPNLPVRRILATPTGTAGTRVAIDGLGAIELQAGSAVWMPVQDDTYARESEANIRLSQMVGSTVRTYTTGNSYLYAGTIDAKIWVWLDNTSTPRLTNTGNVMGPVEKILVDQANPQIALAAVGSHVLRTINGGGFWDPLDGNLPKNAAVHSIAADIASGAIYAATDQGIFWARTQLDTATTVQPNWISLNTGLQQAPATDIMLDPAGIRLYAAIDGYGVYSTAAPHRVRSVRVVNAADLSTRPAAPGGLLSVVGGRVNSATGGSLNYPVLAAADDGSQIQVPFEATGPNVTLALVTQTGRVQLGLRVQPVSPAIFVTHDGAPMLQDADSGLLLDARNAAKSGARVQVFATGLGRVNPDWPTGMPVPLDGPPSVVAPIHAYLNGMEIPVAKATLAPGYIGFYVVEVQLPTLNNAGVNELYISAGGVESNRVPIVIEQ
jgi:uncharacterized protein (TIGR03437 family)